MKPDAFVRRGFPFILGVMIAAAAYFQASALSQLVAYEIARDSAPSAPEVAPVKPPLPGEPATGAAPILERNPFDSTTGPLGAPPEGAQAGQVNLANVDPRHAPLCDAGRVVLIAVSEDKEWSFAAIEDAEGRTTLARRGVAVAGKKIEAIAWDRVWLTSGGARCQMRLGKSGGKAEPQAKAKEQEKEQPEPPRAPVPRPVRKSDVPHEIASHIRRVSETEVDIDRTAAAKIFARPELVTHTSAAMPDMRGNQVVGMKMLIKPGSVLESVGLQNGDTVRSINGIDLTDPQKAMAAYSRMQSDSRLSVVVERDGRPVRLTVNLR